MNVFYLDLANLATILGLAAMGIIWGKAYPEQL